MMMILPMLYAALLYRRKAILLHVFRQPGKRNVVVPSGTHWGSTPRSAFIVRTLKRWKLFQFATCKSCLFRCFVYFSSILSIILAILSILMMTDILLLILEMAYIFLTFFNFFLQFKLHQLKNLMQIKIAIMIYAIFTHPRNSITWFINLNCFCWAFIL